MSQIIILMVLWQVENLCDKTMLLHHIRVPLCFCNCVQYWYLHYCAWHLLVLCPCSRCYYCILVPNLSNVGQCLFISSSCVLLLVIQNMEVGFLLWNKLWTECEAILLNYDVHWPHARGGPILIVALPKDDPLPTLDGTKLILSLCDIKHPS